MMDDDHIVKCWDYDIPTEILIFEIENTIEREDEEQFLDFGMAGTVYKKKII